MDQELLDRLHNIDSSLQVLVSEFQNHTTQDADNFDKINVNHNNLNKKVDKIIEELAEERGAKDANEKLAKSSGAKSGGLFGAVLGGFVAGLVKIFGA